MMSCLFHFFLAHDVTSFEIRYRYSGHITAIHSDGTCDIAYDDGDNEEGKDPALIQLEPGTPRE